MSNEVVDLGWILVEFNTKQKIKKQLKVSCPEVLLACSVMLLREKMFPIPLVYFTTN